MKGGQPSLPHGVTHRDGKGTRNLGTVFSNVPVTAGDWFIRPSAGGGGLYDPLERDLDRVLDDVIDGYVTIEGAARDYGVVIEAVDPELDDYRVDRAATDALRASLRAERSGWLEVPAETVAAALQDGSMDVLTAIRRHGVICDWDDNTLLPRTTGQFREAMRDRAR
jgi:N-methylhydantoinase B